MCICYDRKKAACFNCGGDHQMNECTEPRNPAQISANRNAFMLEKANNMSMNTRCVSLFVVSSSRKERKWFPMKATYINSILLRFQSLPRRG